MQNLEIEKEKPLNGALKQSVYPGEETCSAYAPL